MCVCECVCAGSCPTLCDPMDCSPTGAPVHGTLWARILEWVLTSSSRGSSHPGIVSRVSCIGRWILTTTSPGKPHEIIYMLEQSSELPLPYRGCNRRREGKKLVPGHRGAERQSRDSASTRRRPITHLLTSRCGSFSFPTHADPHESCVNVNLPAG